MEKAHDREKKLISSWPKSIERKRERKREREIRALMIKSSPTKDPTLNTAELGNKPSVYDFYDHQFISLSLFSPSPIFPVILSRKTL
jgi:hypothetical protein